MEENETKNVVNHFEAGANCQVFNGPITGCVFAMPGSTVTQQPVVQHTEVEEEDPHSEEQEEEVIPEGEELCKFIHPAIDKVRARKVHMVLKRLVSSHGIQEICQYMNKMAEEELILQPVNPGTAYKELTRLGMPTTDGYNIKTFQKYYRK